MEREFPYEFSPSLGQLAKALAKAQSEIKDAVKDSVNPHFKSKFASLASVRAAVTPVFSSHGLAVTQLSEPHGDAGVCVVTVLIHAESGEWLRSRLYVPVSKRDAQGFGSALSYARRYALAMIANIATDDDDDANEAVRPPRQESRQETKAANDTKKEAATVDIAGFLAGINAANNTDELAKALLPISKDREKLSTAQRNELNQAREAKLRSLEAAS